MNKEALKYCLCINTCYALGENKDNKHTCCYVCRQSKKCPYSCIEDPTKCKLNVSTLDTDELVSMLTLLKENKEEKENDGRERVKRRGRRKKL